jgi:DegV family protein with EDD domain
MPGSVAIVTDSTACIPLRLAAARGIAVVQQQLRIGDRDMDDEARVPGQVVLDALLDGQSVTTAPPDPGAFFWAYQDAAARGATSIVSIHLSSHLSRTCELAKEAAEQARVPVHVLDTGTLGMSLGYAVLAASRVARAGGVLGQVLTMAEVRISRSTELLHVDTLEYLRRGGRISAASQFIGTALSLKPMLTLRRGKIVPIDRTVGSERAVRKLVNRAIEVAGNRAVDIAVQHIGADDRVAGIIEELRGRLPNAKEMIPVPVTSIIAAHVGPGALGISISPAV